MNKYKALEQCYQGGRLVVKGEIFSSAKSYKELPVHLELVEGKLLAEDVEDAPVRKTAPRAKPNKTDRNNKSRKPLKVEPVQPRKLESTKGAPVEKQPAILRSNKITMAMQAMQLEDPSFQNPKFWIGNGMPEIAEVQRRTGITDITDKERNEKWLNIVVPPSGQSRITS